MKRISLMVASAILTISGSALAQDQQPEFTLNIATIAPENTPWAHQLEEMEERFERESGGRLRVRVFLGSPDGELSLVRQCQDGGYQGIGVSTAAMASQVPQLGVFELPFLFSSLEEADHIIDDILFDRFEGYLAAAGFQLYIFSENGYRNFATSNGEPIHTPAQLADLQMRVQENWIHEEMYNALGGNPVRIAVPEVITALQTGNVQGFDQTPLYAFAASWYQGIDTWTVSDHIYQPAVVVYNKEWFDSLPADIQELLLSNREAETASGRRLIRTLTPALLQNLENSGVTVYEMTDEERAAFAAATRSVHDMFRERVDDGGELLDLIYQAQ
ncbi:MAG: TRAP transporter substrate-binding protein [Myxococcales bacterium]|nr:TRAP transporter substrate-binding protein [Myxococcales bacterium]